MLSVLGCRRARERTFTGWKAKRNAKRLHSTHIRTKQCAEARACAFLCATLPRSPRTEEHHAAAGLITYRASLGVTPKVHTWEEGDCTAPLCLTLGGDLPPRRLKQKGSGSYCLNFVKRRSILCMHTTSEEEGAHTLQKVLLVDGPWEEGPLHRALCLHSAYCICERGGRETLWHLIFLPLKHLRGPRFNQQA